MGLETHYYFVLQMRQLQEQINHCVSLLDEVDALEDDAASMPLTHDLCDRLRTDARTATKLANNVLPTLESTIPAPPTDHAAPM